MYLAFAIASKIGMLTKLYLFLVMININQPAVPNPEDAKLAIHGGPPAIVEHLAKVPRWGKEELHQLESMLQQDSLFYWKGAQTALFTERFRKHYPFKYIMPCSSGTAAVHLALAAAGIGLGDEVITTPLTDMGSLIGILHQQAVPVFADVQADNSNLDPEDVARKISARTRAIVAVHFSGNPCDMHALKKLADKFKLILIEDCAQAWGARWEGRAVGTIGHVGCYSLNDFKHISCGDGGVVGTNDDSIGPLLQAYGDKGYDRVTGTRMPSLLGYNYRISEPQSAIAAAQMSRMQKIADSQAVLGKIITEELTKIEGIMPHRVDSRSHCTYWFYQFRIILEKFSCTREELLAALRAENVPCAGGHYKAAVYSYPVFQNENFLNGGWPVKMLGLTEMDYKKVRCPVAEDIVNTAIVIPLRISNGESDAFQLVQAIKKVTKYFLHSVNTAVGPHKSVQIR